MLVVTCMQPAATPVVLGLLAYPDVSPTGSKQAFMCVAS